MCRSKPGGEGVLPYKAYNVLGEKKLKTGLKFSRETVKNAVIRRNCKTGFSVLVKPDFRQTHTVKVGYFDIFPVAHTYP